MKRRPNWGEILDHCLNFGCIGFAVGGGILIFMIIALIKMLFEALF